MYLPADSFTSCDNHTADISLVYAMSSVTAIHEGYGVRGHQQTWRRASPVVFAGPHRCPTVPLWSHSSGRDPGVRSSFIGPVGPDSRG
jgi:hypothetical protein